MSLSIKDMEPDSIKKVVLAKMDLMCVNEVVVITEAEVRKFKSKAWIKTARGHALQHPLCFTDRHKYRTAVINGELLIGRVI